MVYDDFKKKTYNDWWLSGDNIILDNVADEIVNVKCSKSHVFTFIKASKYYTIQCN